MLLRKGCTLPAFINRRLPERHVVERDKGHVGEEIRRIMKEECLLFHEERADGEIICTAGYVGDLPAQTSFPRTMPKPGPDELLIIYLPEQTSRHADDSVPDARL
jgi:hypothetical protein